VSDNVLTIALYTGGGLLAVVVIFLGALWFANTAKKGNMRFKWRQLRRVQRRSGADPERPPSDLREKGAGPPRQ
jgi:hypothetical protein